MWDPSATEADRADYVFAVAMSDGVSSSELVAKPLQPITRDSVVALRFVRPILSGRVATASDRSADPDDTKGAMRLRNDDRCPKIDQSRMHDRRSLGELQTTDRNVLWR